MEQRHQYRIHCEIFADKGRFLEAVRIYVEYLRATNTPPRCGFVVNGEIDAVRREQFCPFHENPEVSYNDCYFVKQYRTDHPDHVIDECPSFRKLEIYIGSRRDNNAQSVVTSGRQRIKNIV